MAAKEDDELEDKVINEQYKTWKVNSRYLYDLAISYALEWPSLTIQWLPGKYKSPGIGLQEHRLILGTHTSDAEQNYLIIAKVIHPELDADPPVTVDGPFPARVEIVQRINHDGEVNRARYMPQNPSIIATKAPAAEVYIFDVTKQPAKPDTDGVARPDLKLTGHDKEGYGLCWNSKVEGRLLSGSDDANICIWDVAASHADRNAVEPVVVLKGHSSVVEDVAWHCSRPELLGSVGDDRQLLIWDERQADKKPCQQCAGAHAAEINCVSFSPFNEHLVATGSADKTVALWDTRNLSGKLHAFDHHTDEIVQIAWSPAYETILMSCSQDRKVNIWDISRIGDEQTAEDAQDGPPELLFQHGGHTSKVSDVAWNPGDPWMCASVAEDNVLQVWSMASAIYRDDDDASLDERAMNLD